MSRSGWIPMTSSRNRLFRILPLATVALVLVVIGGPKKLSELPEPARLSLLACMVFAFIEPVLPGRRFGGKVVVARQTVGL
jgi:hypothetical protein